MNSCSGKFCKPITLFKKGSMKFTTFWWYLFYRTLPGDCCCHTLYSKLASPYHYHYNLHLCWLNDFLKLEYSNSVTNMNMNTNMNRLTFFWYTNLKKVIIFKGCLSSLVRVDKFFSAKIKTKSLFFFISKLLVIQSLVKD